MVYVENGLLVITDVIFGIQSLTNLQATEVCYEEDKDTEVTRDQEVDIDTPCDWNM